MPTSRRSWAGSCGDPGGNLRHCSLDPGSSQAIYDSAYQEVGRWVVPPAPES